jgi:hypothetical protein
MQTIVELPEFQKKSDNCSTIRKGTVLSTTEQRTRQLVT